MNRHILTFDELVSSECRNATVDDIQIVRDMIETLEHTTNGVGLAAPQIGENVRLIVVATAKMNITIVMANPRIIRNGQETVTASEGCLSYPGLSALVQRYKIIDVSYGTIEEPDRGLECTFRDMTARIIQHEIDHLYGVCKVAGGEPKRRKNRPASAIVSLLAKGER